MILITISIYIYIPDDLIIINLICRTTGYFFSHGHTHPLNRQQYTLEDQVQWAPHGGISVDDCLYACSQGICVGGALLLKVRIQTLQSARFEKMSFHLSNF